MFCAECGTKNEDSARFCGRCGARLISNEPISGRVLSMQSESLPDVVMPNLHNKISKWTIAILLEVIVLVVLAYGVKWIGDKYYSAEYVAGKYFETIMEGDLGKAYEYLEVKESDFISKPLFEKTYEPDSRGRLGSYSVKAESLDDASATVRVTYRVLNESQENTKDIVLLKKAEKKFFIFDNWKVNPGEDITSDIIIRAPQNASVSMDGIRLGAEYKKSAEDGFDIYQISQVFSGKHVLNAAKEGAQPIQQNVEFPCAIDEDGNVVQLPQMHLEKKVLQKVSQNAKSVFKSIMDAKVKETDAGFIDELIADAEGADFTKNYYENFLTVEGSYLRVKDIQVRAMDSSNGDSYYDFNGFSSEDSLTEAGVEVSSNCIYQDAYGYEVVRQVSAMFYYGYLDGKLSLLAVELESEGTW